MSNLLLVLMMTLTLVTPFAGPRNRPPIANDDELVLLYHPVPTVDIPVLENDTDPDSDPLVVTSLPMIDGGKAEIVGGNVVRVYLDWSTGVGYLGRLVAHGTYVVSDGIAQSRASWYVWYWPEIQP